MLGRRGVSPEIPDLAALGYPPSQNERGQMTVGGWRVGVGGDVNVPCDLLSLLMLRHAGVGVGGGDVNVPMWPAHIVDGTPRRGWGGGSGGC